MTIAVEKNIDEDKHIQGTTRYMWFRTDGFVDAGGRFADMPDKIEYGAKNYIEAFEEGVRKSIKEKVNDADIKIRKEKEVAEREERANDYVNSLKNDKVDADKNEELMVVVSKKFADANKATKTKVKEILSENGFSNFKTPNEIPTAALQQIVDILNED